MKPALTVVSGGLNTTIQDLGRTGNQKLGIAVAGALDWISLRLANALVGNPQGMEAFELSYLGPTLEVAADAVRIALVGTRADVEIVGSDRRVKAGESARLERGTRFRVGGFS
ncbi:MAG: allophanate hydrolase, partial [Hyphomicrobiaceae bacterium]